MTLAFWRDLALVWLALLCFIGMAVPLVAAFFAVKGMAAVLDRTPQLFGKAHAVSNRVREQSAAGNRQVVSRVTDLERRASKLAATVQKLTPWRTGPTR